MIANNQSKSRLQSCKHADLSSTRLLVLTMQNRSYKQSGDFSRCEEQFFKQLTSKTVALMKKLVVFLEQTFQFQQRFQTGNFEMNPMRLVKLFYYYVLLRGLET